MTLTLVILLTLAVTVSQWLAVYLNLPTTVNPAILLGIILISALVAGNIIKGKTVPAITGFILYGLLIGPHGLNLIGQENIQSLDFIHFLSLFLIAFLAGGRLNLKEHKHFYSLVPLISFGQLLLTLLLTGIVIRLFSKGLFPQIGDNLSVLIIYTLFTGLILTSNSTAAILAINHENQPRKITGDFILGVSLLTNIFVIVFFLGKAVLFQFFIQQNAVISSGTVIVKIALHLAAGILTGSVLGFLFVMILSKLRREFLFFIILFSICAYVSVSSYLSESLIAFITAGIILRNFSRRGNHFMKDLEQYSTPLFIVYFTLTAAGFNLTIPRNFIPLLIVLFFIRMIAVGSATQLTLRISGQKSKTAAYLSFSFLSQSGLTLGLLSYLSLFQESLITHELYAVLIWITFLNLLVGPPVLKYFMNKLKTF